MKKQKPIITYTETTNFEGEDLIIIGEVFDEKILEHGPAIYTQIVIKRKLPAESQYYGAKLYPARMTEPELAGEIKAIAKDPSSCKFQTETK